MERVSSTVIKFITPKPLSRLDTLIVMISLIPIDNTDMALAAHEPTLKDLYLKLEAVETHLINATEKTR